MRVLRAAFALLLLGCASTGGMPVQPFRDVPVPDEWVAYSRQWVMIETPRVTTAKLVYFAETSVERTMARARELLVRAGWTEGRSEPFVNPERFPGVRAEFRKGEDVCRVTVIEGRHGTHVDYVVARVTGGA